MLAVATYEEPLLRQRASLLARKCVRWFLCHHSKAIGKSTYIKLQFLPQYSFLGRVPLRCMLRGTTACAQTLWSGTTRALSHSSSPVSSSHNLVIS